MGVDVSGVLYSAVLGVLSFVSPCFLPILPGFLSFIAGTSIQEIQADGIGRRGAVAGLVSKVAIFVLGFSLVFSLLGASATALGGLLREHLGTLRIVAGVVLLVFGFHMTGLVRIPFLLVERKIQAGHSRTGIARALVGGIFFALGWSPCIGPFLTGALTLAAQEKTVYQGIAYLISYSAGLGVPLLLSALFFQSFMGFFARTKRFLRGIEIASGLLLGVFGILLITDQFGRISSALNFMSEFSERAAARFDLRMPDSIEPGESGEEVTFPVSSEVETLDGSRARLSAYPGRLVLFNFFATWCGPCRLETPGFVELYSRYKKQGFQIVAIGEDSSREEIRDFMTEFKMNYPVVVDPEGRIADELGILGLPASYLVDEQGKVARSWPGQVREKDLEGEIRKRIGAEGD